MKWFILYVIGMLIQGFPHWHGAIAPATSLGLQRTHAIARIEMIAAKERGAPLSQSRLRRYSGLTIGATASLLNRRDKRKHLDRPPCYLSNAPTSPDRLHIDFIVEKIAFQGAVGCSLASAYRLSALALWR